MNARRVHREGTERAVTGYATDAPIRPLDGPGSDEHPQDALSGPAAYKPPRYPVIPQAVPDAYPAAPYDPDQFWRGGRDKERDYSNVRGPR